MKKVASLRTINGVDHLMFCPVGTNACVMIPVITKGSRERANAWTWNGSLEKPMVRPSVRTEYANDKGETVMIHYWLNDGVCVCLSDCTDGNANKALELKEL